MDSGFIVRILYEADLKEALELVERVFDEFEAPEYAEEGVRTFKEFTAYPAVLQKFKAGLLSFWGCYVGDEIVGVLAFRDRFSHISMLFVEKAFHRRGAARSLVNAALDFIKSNTEVSALTVNSSPYAVAAYERLGFVATDTEQCQNGILYTPMKLSV